MSMIVKVPKPRAPELEPESDSLPPSGPWSAAAYLYARSLETRRVMFLELIAWAIYQAETCGSRDDFAAFELELREVRIDQWGIHPWNGGKNPEPFLRHVQRLAESFTAEPVSFFGRRREPIEQLWPRAG